MPKLTVFYWFECPECGFTWACENRISNQEWCANCFSALAPFFLYEETGGM